MSNRKRAASGLPAVPEADPESGPRREALWSARRRITVCLTLLRREDLIGLSRRRAATASFFNEWSGSLLSLVWMAGDGIVAAHAVTHDLIV